MVLFAVLALVTIILLVAMLYPPIFLFLGKDAVNWLGGVSKACFFGGGETEAAISGQDIFAVGFLLLFAVVAAKALTYLNGWLKFKSRKNETFKVLFLNFAKCVVVLTSLCRSLDILGANMVVVFAGLGVMVLVIGFGAQTLIEDVITGLFIAFEDQFCVGDIISSDGYRGTVTSIGIRTTCVTDAGGNVKIIRNSQIKNPVNLSGSASCAVVDISIAYSESIERTERVLQKALPIIYANNPDIFQAEPAYAGVQNLGPSSVDLRIVGQVAEENIFKARRILNRELKIAFDENNIEVPFPQVKVWNGKQAGD